ncbi:MAG: hypothetical protein H0T89_08645 [Deltaproteobacteria bacterium]|nr:hypothetical protein [Deltaproteobacteria bacterium]
MDAKRPNSPRGRSPEDNVRSLQGQLRDVAKQQPGRKFHALYDRIHRSDVLQEAWNQVRRNQGAAGVDTQTIAAIEQQGVESFLEAIRAELRENEYRPQAVLRRYIPKADGKQRPLGIPSVRDRVVQTAAKLVLEPIFEVGFKDCSYGFRPKRSTTQALEKIRVESNRGFNYVLDADIRDFFGNIDHQSMLSLVAAEALLGAGMGETTQARLLPPALAFNEEHEADPTAREGDDSEATKSRGSSRRDRRDQSRAAWLGSVLPHRKCCGPLQRHRRLRRVAPQADARASQRSPPETWRSSSLETVLFLHSRTSSPWWHRRLPGGCVMPHHVLKRPPVSRVREIRTHGLKGGLAGTRFSTGKG